MAEIRLTKSGIPVGENELDDVERQLRVTLPADYRKFLINSNGGIPKPSHIMSKGCEKHQIAYFYSARSKTADRDLVAMTEYCRDELDLPKRFLPIALLNESDVLLLKLGPPNGVYAWTFIESGFEKNRMSLVSESFEQLLSTLCKESRQSFSKTSTVLHRQIEDAIARGNTELLRKLVVSADDLNYVPKGSAPLPLCAIRHRNTEALRVLADAGCKLNAKDNNGNPILREAQSGLEFARMELELNDDDDEKVRKHLKEKLDRAEQVVKFLKSYSS